MRQTETVLHFARALLPAGWARDVRVAIANGTLAAIDVGVAPRAGDSRHAIALPGMPNLHSHAFQRGMAGLAESRGESADSFWTWRAVMYRFADRLTPDQLAAIAAMAYVEMLETGFTRVGEFHYLHHDPAGAPYANRAAMAEAIVAAAAETGIGLTLLPVFYAHGGFGGAAPIEGQRRFLHDIDGYARLLDESRSAARPLSDARVGIAPHSLRAVTPEQLALLERLAGDDPIHIHIAEQVREVEDCLVWSGATPVQWLLGNAPVDDRWCLVHATHMTDAETLALARSGAVAGLCPITEANLGDGIFPAAEYLAAGGRIGIGSDSNVLIDMTEELRVLEYGQRLTRRVRNALASDRTRSTGRALFASALAGGAQALGAPAALAPGNAADIVSLDAAHPALLARDDDALLDSLIFAAGRGAIDGVWRRGEQLVSGGRHRARAGVEAGFREVLEAILANS